MSYREASVDTPTNKEIKRQSTSWFISARNAAGQLFAPIGQKCSQKPMWKVRRSRLAVRRIAAALKPCLADKRTTLLNSLGGARSKRHCHCQYGSNSLTRERSIRISNCPNGQHYPFHVYLPHGQCTVSAACFFSKSF